ncbi:MAG: hypothetical protein IJV27_07840 [Prevotella sp.]|nr:hypothetical protein [Prevotella sp.]
MGAIRCQFAHAKIYNGQAIVVAFAEKEGLSREKEMKICSFFADGVNW